MYNNYLKLRQAILPEAALRNGKAAVHIAILLYYWKYSKVTKEALHAHVTTATIDTARATITGSIKNQLLLILRRRDPCALSLSLSVLVCSFALGVCALFIFRLGLIHHGAGFLFCFSFLFACFFVVLCIHQSQPKGT